MHRISFVVLFSCFISWSQQDFLPEKFKGKIKSVASKTFLVKDDISATNHNYFTIKNFDREGLMTSVKYFGDNEQMDLRDTLVYKNGKILKIETFKANGSLDKSNTFGYDSNGNLILEKKLNSKKEVETQTKFQYIENNLLFSKEHFFPSINFTTTYRYFYNFNLQVIEISKEIPSDMTFEKFAYSSEGYIKEKNEYNAKNELFSTTWYEYNGYGDKISLFKFDINGDLTYFEQYELDHDITGNWVEKKNYQKGVLVSVEKRVISYYY